MLADYKEAHWRVVGVVVVASAVASVEETD